MKTKGYPSPGDGLDAETEEEVDLGENGGKNVVRRLGCGNDHV